MNKKNILISCIVFIFLISLVLNITIYSNNRRYKSDLDTYCETIDFLSIENLRLKDSIILITNQIDSLILETQKKFIYQKKYREVEVYKFDMGSPKYVDTIPKDSVYVFSEDSDSVKYNLEIKSDKLYWYKLNFAVTDNIGFINKKDTVYLDTIIYKEKQKTFLDRLFIGPVIGYGYTYNKLIPYIGIGVGINIF